MSSIIPPHLIYETVLSLTEMAGLYWLAVGHRDPSVSSTPPCLAFIWILDLEFRSLGLCGTPGCTKIFSIFPALRAK